MQKKLLIATVVSAALLSGCGDNPSKNQAAPVPLVTVQPVDVAAFKPSKSYIGRVEAIEDTAITAQVSGYLEGRHFQEGQMVNKGDLLYTIDASAFAAQVASAHASVAQASAALKKAKLDFERGEELLPSGSISHADFDALTAVLLGAEAQLEANKAHLAVAEVNLSYTSIRAPITGRISDSKASKGDLVSPSSGILTTLVSLNPIHTAFSISERERLTLGMDRIKGDGSSESNEVEVQVLLEGGSAYEHLGELDFLGNRIDVNTGTIASRAVISNPEHRLLPGQHVRIKLRQVEAIDVVSIPRRAVQTDLEGDFVMLLTEGNIAERRNVMLGEQIDHNVIIKSGVNDNDIVITQGLQTIRNGVTVQPSDADK